MKIRIIQKIVFSIIITLISTTSFGQKYWETGFWKKFINDNNKDSLITIKKTYKNGNEKMTGQIKDEKPHGIWKFFAKNGDIIIESNYNGDYYYFSHQHLTKSEQIGKYKNGKKVGIWYEKYYDRISDSLLYINEVDFDLGFIRKYDEYDNLKSTKKENPEKINLRYLYPGGWYIDAGIANFNTNFDKISDFLKTEDNLNTTSNNIGLLFGAACNINNTAYIHYSISFLQNTKFKTQNDDLKYSLKSIHQTFGIGIDFIKSDNFDICPSIGLVFNKFSFENSNYDNIANAYRLGGNAEVCFRFNATNKKGIHETGGVSFALKAGYHTAFSKTEWETSEEYLFNETPEIGDDGFYISFTVGLFLRNFSGF